MRAEFKELGATILGISADQVDRQKEFADENDLGFPLLSDVGKNVAKQFGVKRRRPLPTKRSTFVIDEQATVLFVISSELDMNAHADEALGLLRSL